MQGELVDTCLEIIEKQNVDFVVLSTNGASGLEEFFLGSLTAKLMTLAKIAVLGIPKDAKFKSIDRIGFTTKFKNDDAIALNKLILLNKIFNAKIDCLYVKTKNSVVDNSVIEHFKNDFTQHNITFHIIESNDVEDTILDFITLHQLDLLAVLNHKHGFFDTLFNESLTKKLAYHIHIPLLALHND